MKHDILQKLIYKIYSKKEKKNLTTYHISHFQRLSSPRRKTFNIYYNTFILYTNNRKLGLLWIYIPRNQGLSFSASEEKQTIVLLIRLKIFKCYTVSTWSKCFWMSTENHGLLHEGIYSYVLPATITDYIIIAFYVSIKIHTSCFRIKYKMQLNSRDIKYGRKYKKVLMLIKNAVSYGQICCC